MKILITLALVIALSLSTKAQWVTIPDVNFAYILNLYFPSCMNGNQMDTTCVEIINAEYLYVNNQDIIDLWGAQFFYNLTEINCSNNELTSIPSLPASLNALYCSKNQLTSLSNLPETLNILFCDSNQLASLPVLPSMLTQINCSNNQLTSLPSLPSTLNDLDCSNNQLISLPSLPSSLNKLRCSNNLLTILPNLPTPFYQLYCSNNQLTSLPSLPSTLNYLDCSNNQLTSLPSLPSSLNKLRCSNNLLTILPNLPTPFYQLYCSDNQLTSLPSLPSTLNDLDCSSNQLPSLPNLPLSLTQLRCYNNQITSLPILPSTISYLDCSNNQLTSLPSLPSSLNKLRCSNNLLTILPNLPTPFYQLYCSSNQLTSLPSLPPTLNELDCSNNQLTSLPALPQTIYLLRVQNNTQLTCLPVFNKIISPTQENFNISNTAITCLPNVIQHPTINSWPAIDTVPICDIINPNNCTTNWSIRGTVSFDIDNDCVTTEGNTAINNMKIKLLDANNFELQPGYTDGAGRYSFKQGFGAYHIQLSSLGPPYSVLCPVNNDIFVILNSTNTTSINNNFQFIYQGTGIYNISSASNLSLYPNPASDVLFIQPDQFIGRGSLRVFNSLGVLVMEKQITDNNINMEVSHWPPGIYYLNLSTEKASAVRGFVIQH